MALLLAGTAAIAQAQYAACGVTTTTGAATLAFDVGNAPGNVGFNFNPTADRIRVVSSTGTNFRLNPLDGSTTVDGAYTFAMGDVNFGRVPSFTAAAYTNADTDPATGTSLYGIDPTLGHLIRIATRRCHQYGWKSSGLAPSALSRALTSSR